MKREYYLFKGNALQKCFYCDPSNAVKVALGHANDWLARFDAERVPGAWVLKSKDGVVSHFGFFDLNK